MPEQEMNSQENGGKIAMQKLRKKWGQTSSSTLLASSIMAESKLHGKQHKL